nr:hypothetical protein [Tanacetum cinerariifolium]
MILTLIVECSHHQTSPHTGSDEGSTTSRSSISEFGDDNFVVGKWDNTEIISRYGLMKLDTLVREGSSEWRDLCENEVYRKHFPDKHFDLETVLESKTRNLEVVPEYSFVGFFQLEDGVFDFLDGAMSFDNIWDEINAKAEHTLVSKGKESCKEYIKSFLAGIPLRELQADVKKGLMAASSPLVHHRLQIEFHYTKCLEVNTNMSNIAV